MGGSKKTTVGYRYNLGMHMILCHGPVDKMLRLRADGKDVWMGDRSSGRITINNPDMFGGEDREGGIAGALDFEPGWPTQGRNDYLQSRLGVDIPAFRGVAGLVLRHMYLGTNPYLKPWSARLSRIHVRQDGIPQWHDSRAEIRGSAPFRVPQSFYFAIDTSGSMNEGVTFLKTRLDVVKEAMHLVLDRIDVLRIDSKQPVHIGICGWGDSSTRLHINNVTTASINQLKSFVSGLTASGSTDFRQAVQSALAWFNPDVKDNRRRSFFFMTDGVPNTGTAEQARDLAWDLLDRNNGQYSYQNGVPVDCYAINIDLGYTFYSAMLDNTPQDGVPVVDSAESDAIYNTVFFAVMGESPSMNPAHIIRECDTDPDWGMGYPETDIDEASFIAAANQLHAENFGLSLLWSRQVPIEDFRDDVIRHIDAVHYVDRKTGKFVLKLIRGGYNPDALLVLNESNIDRIENFTRPMPDELINSVTVKFWDVETGNDAAVTVDDPALVQMFGRVISTTVSYPGIPTQPLAARVAMRDLRVLSQPLASCTVYATGAAANLAPGSVFKLEWPDLEIAGLVMRVTGIAFGDGKSSKVRIQCVEDVFVLPETSIIAQPPNNYEPIDQPTIAEHRAVIEAPYFEVVQRMGQAQADSLLQADEFVGFFLASARRPSSALNATLMVDAGGGYEDSGIVDFCPSAFLAVDVGQMETVFEITMPDGIENIAIGSHAQIGDELVRIDAVTDTHIAVGRGALDTVPAKHAVGTAILAWDAFAEGDGTEYVAGESVGVRMLPSTGSGKVDLSAAPTDEVVFAQRALRPFPPARMQINEMYFPDALAGALTITWASRNRKQQTGGELLDFMGGPVTPEDGTTYTVRVFNVDASTLKHETTGITTSSHIVPEVDLLGATRLRIELTSVRDGLESNQSQHCELEWDSSANLMTFAGDYSPDSGDAVALQFSED